MIQKEVLAELERMTDEERLEVIETATRLIRASQGSAHLPRRRPQNAGLARAAEIMRAEYESDSELTAFTALDAEDFRDV